MPKLRELPPGTRFRLPECRKTGVLLSLGSAGARVKYDGAEREVEISPDADTGRQGVNFVAPGRPTLISDEAFVEVIP